MTAETVCVGTEILLGNIVNTNAAYLAGQYAALGIASYYQTAVGDNEERIMAAIGAALSRGSDLVVINGGLGPTQDDITKDCTAKLLGRTLYEDAESFSRIKEFFGKRGSSMSANNARQALVVKGSEILPNDNGLAPGMFIELKKAESKKFGSEKKQYLMLLPGPPEELRIMWEKYSVPILRKLTGSVIYSAMVKVCGRSESEVADILDDLITNSKEVTVAPYAKTGEVHLRVTAAASDEKDAKKLVKPVVKEIKSRLGDSVYTTHEETSLEQSVVDLLLANKLTVTTAESCTGGLVAGRLINVPGVSEIFKSGYITYSNKAKRKIIGVKKKTLQKFGAVSAEVVKEMAEGVAFYSRADVSVAVSGIAGPDGGSEEKPVGLVYIGVNVCGHVTVKEYHFSGNREKIRNNSVAHALILMRQCILEYYSRLTFGEAEQ
ncbi:MAG: competence/damage-inducible protein A [Lachnospiraceae bacterium]|nr:competence/damage-inducible protein A [Lachnospiraceae bacterium]